jgi:hypothetical protein
MNCDQNSRSTLIAWSTNSFMWYLYYNFVYIGINHAAAQSIKEVDTNSRGYYWREDLKLQECAHSSCMNIACLAAHQKLSMNWAHSGTLDRRLHCNLSFPRGSSWKSLCEWRIKCCNILHHIMIQVSNVFLGKSNCHPQSTLTILVFFLTKLVEFLSPFHAISHAKLAYGRVISSHVFDY